MFTKTEKTSMGYQLFDLGNDKWKMTSPSGSFTGNLKDVVHYSVKELGFNVSELELGVIEMEKNFMDAAEYGHFKTFMWPFDQSKGSLH